MKLELSDGMSNQSDEFSNDSQNSQMSTADFMTSMGNGVLLTPTTFIAFEGLNSGVPTRTTPTLTPTTLRSIEQTFYELQSKSESHENEAGFVPPLVHSIGNNQYVSASETPNLSTTTDLMYASPKSQSMWLSQSSSDSNTTHSPPPEPLAQKTSQVNNTPPPNRRNMGGRKPTKDLNISPEEEERRRVRRERNKAAAARCRKRRVDHTNQLVLETEELEGKRQRLMETMHELKALQEELEYQLEQHRAQDACRLGAASPPDVKPFEGERRHGHGPHHHHHHHTNNNDRIKVEPIATELFTLPALAKRVMFSATTTCVKPSRPSSLNVTIRPNEVAGVPITTPSAGMQFNFDSMMGGGTGLTPVSGPLQPSCSTQQRNLPIGAADLTSPDAKLVSL